MVHWLNTESPGSFNTVEERYKGITQQINFKD